MQLLSDLAAGLTGSDHQDRAVRQRRLVAVLLGVQLGDLRRERAARRGILDAWNAPVATTTLRASTVPLTVVTRSPASPGARPIARAFSTTGASNDPA